MGNYSYKGEDPRKSLAYLAGLPSTMSPYNINNIAIMGRGGGETLLVSLYIFQTSLVSSPYLFQFGTTTKPWSCYTFFSHLSKQIRNQINTNMCQQHLYLQTVPCNHGVSMLPYAWKKPIMKQISLACNAITVIVCSLKTASLAHNIGRNHI